MLIAVGARSITLEIERALVFNNRDNVIVVLNHIEDYKNPMGRSPTRDYYGLIQEPTESGNTGP